MVESETDPVSLEIVRLVENGADPVRRLYDWWRMWRVVENGADLVCGGGRGGGGGRM